MALHIDNSAWPRALAPHIVHGDPEYTDTAEGLGNRIQHDCEHHTVSDMG